MNLVSTYEKIIDGLANQNYIVVDDFFDEVILEGLRTELIRKATKQELKIAGIGNKSKLSENDLIRSDKIEWINNESENEFEKAFILKIKDFSSYLNRTCYAGINEYEFHYACFEKGTFYRKHIDRFRSDDRRKYSFVTYLNKDWNKNDGGALQLYLVNETIQVLPQWGQTVIFKSDLIEHEVLENTIERLSITGWLK